MLNALIKRVSFCAWFQLQEHGLFEIFWEKMGSYHLQMQKLNQYAPALMVCMQLGLCGWFMSNSVHAVEFSPEKVLAEFS
jgi:hypothetical protein